MRSPLCDAVARCHLRRLRRAVAVAPLPAAVAATLVVLAPLALGRVGRAVGDELAGAAGSAGVAEALVLGPMLAAAAAGTALAVSYPGPSALGQQLAAGPGGETVAVLACLLVPALVGAVVVLPSLVALCVALAVELPGGALSGVALAVAVVAAVPAGAIVAEGGLAAASRRRRRPLAIGAGAVAWAGVGVVAGAAPLGPFAVVGPALRGTASSWSALLVAVVGMVALVVAWGRLVVSRPARRSRPAGRSRSLGRAGRLSEPAALAALMSRRHDVRCATVAAIGFGVAGIAIATAARATAPTPFLLATTTALLGAILCPLAVCGVLLGGRWLWVGGPGDRAVLVRAASLVGFAGSLLPVAVVGVVATVASGASWSAAGTLAAFVVVGSAAGLLAGSLVPWHGEGVGDQLTTFAALAAVVVAGSLAVGLIAPRLVSMGLPDAVVAALVCVAWSAAALLALGSRFGGVPG